MGRLHPLRMAYVKYVREHYGVYIGGDKNPGKTELVAQKVSSLGIPYDVFVEAACLLWHKWSEGKGWEYPYWNLVTSDTTFGMLKRLRDVEESTVCDEPGHAEAFDAELGYALDYVRWFVDGDGGRPRRTFDKDPRLVVAVAEYLCVVHGIDYKSSDYNCIAAEIGARFEQR